MSLRFRSIVRVLQNWRDTARRAFAMSLLIPLLASTSAMHAIQAAGQVHSAETLGRDADAAYDRGDVQQAIRLYRELLKMQPDSVAARTNLGVALARIGDYSNAAAEYNKALKQAPDNEKILLDLALAYYKQAVFDAAAADLEHLRAKHPENRQSLYLLADCYLRLGRNEDVVALLQPAYDADPHDRAVEFALGMALIRTGQSEKGEAIIKDVAMSADQSEVDLLTGAAELAARDSKAAVTSIHKALDAAPNLPGAWSLYGQALQDSGDRAGAKVAFQKALQLDSNDFEANLYLGGMLRYGGDIEAAGPYLEKALVLRPNSVEAEFQIGLLNLARGRQDLALSEFEQVEHQSPDFKEVHVQLASLYARLHRVKDSEREQAKVLELDQRARGEVPGQPQP
jgi:tetratricopeptide (TPR) repeat protein